MEQIKKVVTVYTMVHGRVEVQIHSFLTSALDGLSHLHAPAALLPRKKPHVPIKKEAGKSPTASLDAPGKDIDSYPTENQTMFHQTFICSLITVPHLITHLLLK